MPTGHLVDRINEIKEGLRTDIQHMLFLEAHLEEYCEELIKRM